jgi:hypothetical protein
MGDTIRGVIRAIADGAPVTVTVTEVVDERN